MYIILREEISIHCMMQAGCHGLSDSGDLRFRWDFCL